MAGQKHVPRVLVHPVLGKIGMPISKEKIQCNSRYCLLGLTLKCPATGMYATLLKC